MRDEDRHRTGHSQAAEPIIGLTLPFERGSHARTFDQSDQSVETGQSEQSEKTVVVPTGGVHGEKPLNQVKREGRHNVNCKPALEVFSADERPAEHQIAFFGQIASEEAKNDIPDKHPVH